jgi:hypothetical protein
VSREIKFAFWHNWKKEMWSVDSIDWRLKEVWNGGDGANLNDGFLLQYTGLVDKNDKEIFEGDILKIYCENNRNSYFKEVKWLNDPFNKGRWDALDNCVFTFCKIVGNIYENPELITGVKNV